GELALGQGVAPLHEHAFRVLLDVALVHEGHVAAPVLDGVAHGRADEALRALLGHRLDADGRALREADLRDLHLLLEELDDLLRLGRPLLPLDPRVDVRPRELLLAPIGLLAGGVQHPDRGRPDVRTRAVALDEGDDGTIRYLQLAVADRDLLACRDLHVGRHGIALLALAVISRRSG